MNGRERPGKERWRRPRKQVPSRPGDQPPAEDPGHSPRFYKQPNIVHPPPVLPCPALLHSATLLFFAVPSLSLSLFQIFCFCTSTTREVPRRLEVSDKRGQLTGVFGIHGAEDDANCRQERERERRREKERGGEGGGINVLQRKSDDTMSARHDPLQGCDCWICLRVDFS